MTREQIKTIAIKMIKESGLINLTRAGLCKRAEIPDGSFSHIMDCTFTEFLEELSKTATPEVEHSIARTRIHPELRRGNIMKAARELAKQHGYDKITQTGIADAAGVSKGAVYKTCGTMQEIRRSIMRSAVELQIPVLIRQGIDNHNQIALRAPAELKRMARRLTV